jgi:uncharacterized membrane protein
VFAIAITLLVFEIKLPSANGPLLPALAAQWAFFAAYLASFLQIGVYWIAHHITTAYVRRMNGKLLFLNLLFLFAIAFIPFPTELAADRIGSGVDMNVAMGLYGVWMFVVAAISALELVALRSDGLLDDAAFRREAPPALATRYWVGSAVYSVAAIVAFFAPLVALLFYVLAPLYYALGTAKWEPRGASTGERSGAES